MDNKGLYVWLGLNDFLEAVLYGIEKLAMLLWVLRQTYTLQKYMQ